MISRTMKHCVKQKYSKYQDANSKLQISRFLYRFLLLIQTISDAQTILKTSNASILEEQ